MTNTSTLFRDDNQGSSYNVTDATLLFENCRLNAVVNCIVNIKQLKGRLMVLLYVLYVVQLVSSVKESSMQCQILPYH